MQWRKGGAHVTSKKNTSYQNESKMFTDPSFSQQKWSSQDLSQYKNQYRDVLMIYQNNHPILFGFKDIKKIRYQEKYGLNFKMLQEGYYYRCQLHLKNLDKGQFFLAGIQRQVHRANNAGVWSELTLISSSSVFKPINDNPQQNLIKPKIGMCFVKNGQKFIRFGKNGVEKPLDQKVNESNMDKIKIPIINGMKVEYEIQEDENASILFGKILYQKSEHYKNTFRFYGRVDVISGLPGLRFFPFDENMDSMIVLSINEEIRKKLHVRNYSFLMSSNQLSKNIKSLSGYHFRGKCVDWPCTSDAPLIVLTDSLCSSNNLQHISDSITYSHQLDIIYHSWEQKGFSEIALKQGINLLNSGTIRHTNYSNHIEAFTVDQDNRQDGIKFDDAFSIKSVREEPGQPMRYLIGVHIVDVAEYLKAHQSLEKKVYQRMSTLYLPKTYLMFQYTLANFFSLKKNEEKLACSLFFEMTEEGNVDFSTIRFQQTIIKVRENYSHKGFNQILQRQQQSMEKILQSLFKKREKYHKQIYHSNNRASNMVKNIKFCANELSNYLLNMNLKRIAHFQESVKSKVAHFNYTASREKKQSIVGVLQQAKLFISQVQTELKNQNTVQLAGASSSYSYGLRSMPINNLLSSLTLLKFHSCLNKVEFNQFNFCKPLKQDKKDEKYKQKSEKTFPFIRRIFSDCDVELDIFSAGSLQESFENLTENKPGLFVQYIGLIKMRNIGHFENYYQNPKLLQILLKKQAHSNKSNETISSNQNIQENKNLEKEKENQYQYQKSKEYELEDYLEVEDSEESGRDLENNSKYQNLVGRVNDLKKQLQSCGWETRKDQQMNQRLLSCVTGIMKEILNDIEMLYYDIGDLNKKQMLICYLQKIGFLPNETENDQEILSQYNDSLALKAIKGLLNIDLNNFKVDLERQNRLSILRHQSTPKYKSLVWSTPIRDYGCIMGQRIIKDFIHIFKSRLDFSIFTTKTKQLYLSKKKMDQYNWQKSKRTKTSKTNFEIKAMQKVFQMKNTGQYESQFLIVRNSDMTGCEAFHKDLHELPLVKPYQGNVFAIKKGRFEFNPQLFPLRMRVRFD